MSALDRLPASQRVAADVPIRYEDVAQDGRMRLLSMPPVLGPTVWSALPDHAVTKASIQAGVVPILTRLVIEGGEGPISPVDPISVQAGWALAHVPDGAGGAERVHLRMWAEITGRKGRIYPPAPPDAGAPVVVGRVYAEDTFTRLFGPPESRRVTSLAFAGVPDPPGDPIDAHAPTALYGDSEQPWAYGEPFAFGVDDTDANLHVNSLVYPQRFLEAAVTALAAEGPLSARHVEVRFRKPSFAGERVRIGLRTERTAKGLVAVGFVGEADAPDPQRPRATVRIGFGRLGA
jgi:hypothetical protein